MKSVEQNQGHTLVGAGVWPKSHVALVVREVSQLFDSLDPSPFYEKDLDPRAEGYIVASVKEMPRGTPIALVVYLAKSIEPQKGSETICDAIRVHFARQARFRQLEVRQLLRRGWVSLIIGVSFLALSLMASQSIIRWWPSTSLTDLLQHGLVIGGWVAMWRPMEIFLYDWWPIVGERRLFLRLSEMPIRLEHGPVGAPYSGAEPHTLTTAR